MTKRMVETFMLGNLRCSERILAIVLLYNIHVFDM